MRYMSYLTFLNRPLKQIDLSKTCIVKLHKLGICTVIDLLYYFPRTHIIYRTVKLALAKIGETVTVVGKIKSHKIITAKNGRLTIQTWIITNKSGSARLTCTHFYNHRYYQSHQWRCEQYEHYQVGSVVMLSGKVKEDSYMGCKAIDAAEVKVIDQSEIPLIQRSQIQPVYSLTKGVSGEMLQECLRLALKVTQLSDPLPKALRERYELVELQEAIANIHFPPNSAALEVARRRLVFDEFFYLQLGLLRHRYKQRQEQTSAVFAPTGELIEQFYRVLPFKLTGAQQRVIDDILNDLQKPTPMNRLVQGDVGSGKTVVAVVAILAAIQSGYQAALMAPTEVLAEQHYRKLVSWFNLLKKPVELLTGSTKVAKRRQIHAQLETGELPLLVGTHALIQEGVNFKGLGLVVIDEQHRFGVGQRARLQQKGSSPHVLTMTATPIPRTLALTLHGDLDVSQIDELPPGRQQIHTTVLSGKDRDRAYDLIRREVAQGRQAYIVLPLVEESDSLDVKAAHEEHLKLAESIFPQFQVGLLHGRMTSAQKDEAINQFRDNQTQILVSTTVIEVGVDVPNATVMIIENAERFGLSQLHQLRGRVGRGAQQSYCLLMSSSKTETARSRLQVLEQSQDGFFISEMDLQLRGPGEVLGTAQSGLLDFTLANLVKDQELLLLATEAAQKVFAKASQLKCWQSIAEELNRRYDLNDSTSSPRDIFL